MIRILIADDHALLRERFRQLLALLPGVRVEGEAETEAQMLQAIKGGDVDLLLLDISLYQASGAELIRQVRALRETLPILVISMHNEPQVACQALLAGATGYITKDSNPETLLAAIRSTVAGGRFLDPAVVHADTIRLHRAASRTLFVPLSNREREVLKLLVQGWSLPSIAENLLIQRKTVNAHRNRLMEKTGTGSEAELIRYAIEHDLVC